MANKGLLKPCNGKAGSRVYNSAPTHKIGVTGPVQGGENGPGMRQLGDGHAQWLA